MKNTSKKQRNISIEKTDEDFIKAFDPEKKGNISRGLFYLIRTYKTDYIKRKYRYIINETKELEEDFETIEKLNIQIYELKKTIDEINTSIELINNSTEKVKEKLRKYLINAERLEYSKIRELNENEIKKEIKMLITKDWRGDPDA